MVFAPDTEVALRSVVNLINTAANGEEALATIGGPGPLPGSGGLQRSRTAGRGRTGQRPPAARASSPRCGPRTRTPRVDTVNRLLRDARALPQLIKHDSGTGTCTPPRRRRPWRTG